MRAARSSVASILSYRSSRLAPQPGAESGCSLRRLTTMNRPRFWLLLVFTLAAEARICHPDTKFGASGHEWQISAGYSPASATLYGNSPDREFLLAGLRYGYRCRAWGAVSVSFTPAIFPLAVTFQPRQTFTDLQNGRLVDQTLGPKAVYGIGFAPLGFAIHFARTRKVQPLAETLLGVHAATEPKAFRGGCANEMPSNSAIASLTSPMLGRRRGIRGSTTT